MGQKMVSAGNLSRIWGKVKELVRNSLSAATQQADGLMTAADKRKMDSIGPNNVATGYGSTSYNIAFAAGTTALLYVMKTNSRTGDTWLIAGNKALPVGTPAASWVTFVSTSNELRINARESDGTALEYRMVYLATYNAG